MFHDACRASPELTCQSLLLVNQRGQVACTINVMQKRVLSYGQLRRSSIDTCCKVVPSQPFNMRLQGKTSLCIEANSPQHALLVLSDVQLGSVTHDHTGSSTEVTT